MKGTTAKPGLRQLALADAEALLGEHHHAASLGRLVGQACQLSRIGKFALANAANGQKGRSLTVAERDSARFVEQEHIYVTRRLDGTSAGSQHIGRIQSAHAGNADSGQQRADGGRRQAHEQRHQRGDSQRISRAVLRGGKCSEQVQGQRHRKKHQRQRDEQQLESLLVGGLFACGRLDHGDHLIEKALTRLSGHPRYQPIGEHRRASGNRRPIAAALAHDRRRFAGNRAFVHACRPHDDLAVGGHLLARANKVHLPPLQRSRSHRAASIGKKRRPGLPSWRHQRGRALSMRHASTSRLAERSASACALPRPSASDSAKFPNSTVAHSTTQIAAM